MNTRSLRVLLITLVLANLINGIAFTPVVSGSDNLDNLVHQNEEALFQWQNNPGVSYAITCPAGAIQINEQDVGDPYNPTQYIQTILNEGGTGATFCLKAGVHRLQSFVPLDGQTIVGEDGAVLNGAIELTSFQQEAGYWYAPFQKHRYSPDYFSDVCEQDRMCHQAEDLFWNDQLLQSVASLDQVRPGTWYLDASQNRIYLKDDPSGQKVEVSYQDIAIGGGEGPNLARHDYMLFLAREDPTLHVDPIPETISKDVTLRNFVVEKYANPGQFGAIHAVQSDRWLIENITVQLTHGSGLRLGPGMRVYNSRFVHNGQLGVSGPGLARGLGYDIRGGLIEIIGNEMAHNNYAGFQWGWEAGGVKLINVYHTRVRGNYVHDNIGPGLWSDIWAFDLTYENNLVVRNIDTGIFHEISGYATIRGNIVQDNQRPDGTDGIGIHISNSQDTSVYDNLVLTRGPGIRHGIWVTQENRAVPSGSQISQIERYARNNSISGNVIVYQNTPPVNQGQPADYRSGVNYEGWWPGGYQDFWLHSNNRFDNNIYYIPYSINFYMPEYPVMAWAWHTMGGAPITWEDLRQDYPDYRQELNGRLVIFHPSVGPVTSFIVDSNADSPDVLPGNGVCADAQGRCTLRAAVQEANTTESFESIYFYNIDSPIKLGSTLEITQPVAIDGLRGKTCSQAPTQLSIEIDGSTAPPNSTGLLIRSRDTRIRGLAIHSFTGGEGNAILLQNGDAQYDGGINTIECNFIGLRADGSRAQPNDLADGADGIQVRTSHNTIERNIIAGLGGAGIYLNGVSSDDYSESWTYGNHISWNYIGTDVAGNAIGNEVHGIYAKAANNAWIVGNTIAYNDFYGIEVEMDYLSDGSVGNYFGMYSTIADNNIAHNAKSGLFIDGAHGINVQHNTILGNGTNIGSQQMHEVGRFGIEIWATPLRPPSKEDRSLLGSGNFFGWNTIEQNFSDGIRINCPLVEGGCSHNSAYGNIITENQGAGVNFSHGVSNEIFKNRIFANTSLEIDLGDDGITPNDPLDLDIGPNNLQNYPVLSAQITSTDVFALGVLNSAPNQTYRLEFFQSDACDSGFGEGQIKITEANVTTDESGLAYIRQALGSLTAGTFITATAADSNKNTSEFSACVEVEDVDGDGVPNSIEDGAPNSGDGNNDGVPDSGQSNVASVPNAQDGQYITLASPADTRLQNVIAQATPADAPDQAAFPIGVVTFGLTLPTSGSSTVVTLHLPPGTVVNTYYKFGPTLDNPTPHWYEFLYDGTTGAVVNTSQSVVSLYLVDGLRGDSDLTANGQIADPGAPALRPNQAPILTADAISVTVDEGQLATNTGTVSDPDGDTVQVTASAGIVTVSGNQWSWQFSTSDGPTESQVVTIYGDDLNGGTNAVTFGLAINNVAPLVNAGTDATITAGETFTVNASFTDPGTADTHTGAIDFGLGSGLQPATLTQGAGSGTVSGAQAYAVAGTYPVTVCVTDNDGASGCDQLTLTVVLPTIADLVIQAAAGDPTEFTILLAALQAADPSILALLDDPAQSLTVFAPTDAAFQRLFDRSGSTAAELLADQAALNNILLYHVVEGAYDAAALFDLANQGWPGAYLLTLQGTYVEFTNDAGSLIVDHAWVQTADIQAANGIIHAIYEVLDPSYVWGEEGLPFNDAPTLTVDAISVMVDEGQLATNTGTVSDPDGDSVQVMASIGMVSVTGNQWAWQFQTSDGPAESQIVTIYGDDLHGGTNAVTFGLAVNNVAPLVNAGADATINQGATFTVNAIFTDPGTADTHTGAIDFGLGGGLQPATLTESAGSGTVSNAQTYTIAGTNPVTVCITDDDGASGCDQLTLTVLPVVPTEPTIADLVIQAAASDPAEFTILLATLQAADASILALLDDPAQRLTVFAPTDAAFNGMLDARGLTLDQFLADTAALNDLLRYHIISGQYDAATLFDLSHQEWPNPYIRTLQGTYVQFTDDEETLIVDSAWVITPDIAASNGVVHVLGAVLDPSYVWGEEGLP